MKDKNDSEATQFIKAMLGASNMDIELQESDYEVIERQTLNVIAPYYEGVKLIYGTAPIIDLSLYPEVIDIHNVYQTTSGSDQFMQTLFFGQPGVYIWNSNTMDSYLQYISLQTLYSNFTSMKSQTWKFIKPKCYVHGFTGAVILECFVRPTKFSDIEKDSAMYPLAQEYALALAKEIVGRTRSRFTIAGSPYQLDGAALIAEAQAEKESVLNRIIPPIRVY